MRFLNRWGPAILVMLLIFVSSSTPGVVIEAVGVNKESFLINGHIILFFSLAVTLYKAIKKLPETFIFSILYAVTDEFHQMFIQLRSPSLFDIKIDTLAALTAVLILWKLQHILPKKLRNWLNS